MKIKQHGHGSVCFRSVLSFCDPACCISASLAACIDICISTSLHLYISASLHLSLQISISLSLFHGSRLSHGSNLEPWTSCHRSCVGMCEMDGERWRG